VQPLQSLINSLVIPPDLIYLIRDTAPSEKWIPAVAQLEEKIWAVRSQGRVRASHEVGMVVEGLKAKVSLILYDRVDLSLIRETISSGHSLHSSIHVIPYSPDTIFSADQYPGRTDFNPLEISAIIPVSEPTCP
jgi:hypothetical protein